MPTKNQRVATYLPEAVYERLQAFKSERELQGDSQALITILSEFLGVSQQVAHTVDYSAKYVTVEQFNELVSKLKDERPALSESSSELLSKLQALESRIEALEKDFQNEHSSMSQSELLSESSIDRDVPGQLNLIPNDQVSEGVSNLEGQTELSSDSPSELQTDSEWMTTKEVWEYLKPPNCTYEAFRKYSPEKLHKNYGVEADPQRKQAVKYHPRWLKVPRRKDLTPEHSSELLSELNGESPNS
jgi:hypothetical protein